MDRLFEMGAKIDNNWSSDNKDTLDNIEYKSPNECKITIYTQKRRGKIVTIVDGVEISKDRAKEILKRVKSKLGRGGTFKNSSFEFQGECRERLSTLLIDEGFKSVI